MSCTSTSVKQPQASATDMLISPAINNIYKISLLTQTAQVFVSERQLD
jgi:hypothetical protein